MSDQVRLHLIAITHQEDKPVGEEGAEDQIEDGDNGLSLFVAADEVRGHVDLTEHLLSAISLVYMNYMGKERHWECKNEDRDDHASCDYAQPLLDRHPPHDWWRKDW